MPILEGSNPGADIAGGLAGLATLFLGHQANERKAKAEQAQKQQQQAITNQLAQGNLDVSKGRLGVERTNAGLDPNSGAPWQPPSTPAPAAAPGGAGAQPPAAAGLIAGLVGAQAPGQSAPQSPAAPGGSSVTSDLTQQSALAKSMVASQMGIYQSESQQVATLTQQGAPNVLIERHRTAARDALTEAGTWTAKQQAAEAGIQKAQGEDKTNAQTAFFGHEQSLPADPAKALSILKKREQIERGKGFDTASTRQQITDLENRQHQTEVDTDRRRHEGVTEAQGAARVAAAQARANRPRSGSGDSSLANKRFDWERHTWTMTHNPDGTLKHDPKGSPPEKPRGLSVPDEQAITKEAQVQLRDPAAKPADVARSLASKWGLPLAQAQAFVPGSDQPTAAPIVNTPATVNLPGKGKSLSRADAIKVGGPDGVAKAQALGYTIH